MTATLPRKIQRLTVKIHVPNPPSPADKEKLEEAAHSCPVCRSLHPDVQVHVEFTWG
jgi:putative redox protein